MSKSATKSQPVTAPVKKITPARALELWMKGTGRSELADQTGLTRGKLRQAFMKLSGKSWAELNAESGRKIAKKAKVRAAKKPAKGATKFTRVAARKSAPADKEAHSQVRRAA